MNRRRAGGAERGNGEGHRQAVIVARVDLAAAQPPVAADVEAVGELLDRRRPCAARPSASAEMRSLSLTRSSAAPVTRRSPPCVASAASTGSSSMRPGTSAGAMSIGLQPAVADDDPAHRFAAVARPRFDVDVSAHAAQDVDDCRSRWIEADGVDCDLRIRAAMPRRPSRRPRTKCRPAPCSVAAVQPLATLDGDRQPVAGSRRCRTRSSPRSVWSRVCTASVTRVIAVGVQAGEQHGALDLRARDFGVEVDGRRWRCHESSAADGRPRTRCARPCARAGR